MLKTTSAWWRLLSKKCDISADASGIFCSVFIALGTGHTCHGQCWMTFFMPVTVWSCVVGLVFCVKWDDFIRDVLKTQVSFPVSLSDRMTHSKSLHSSKQTVCDYTVQFELFPTELPGCTLSELLMMLLSKDLFLGGGSAFCWCNFNLFLLSNVALLPIYFFTLIWCLKISLLGIKNSLLRCSARGEYIFVLIFLKLCAWQSNLVRLLSDCPADLSFTTSAI